MKFLLDAHLPKKLADFLVWKGYDAIHTLDLPDKNRTKDREINQITVDEKRVLITKDLDFIESLLISGKPYKLIYLTTGNITNRALLELFGKNIDKIASLIEENRMIEITEGSIIVKK